MAILIKRFIQPLQMSVVTLSQVINLSTRKCSNTTSRIHNTMHGTLKHHFADVDYSDHFNLKGRAPKWRNLDIKQVDKLLHSLKEFGFTWQDLMDNPKVLLMPSYTFNYRMQLFKEFGFTNPKIHDLIYCKAHMNSEIGYLKYFGTISDNINVLQYLWENIKDLELPQAVLEEAKERYPQIETTTLGELHMHFLKHYLSQRFNIQVEIMGDFVHKFINKRGPPVGAKAQMNFKPLSMYPAICNILLNDLQYDFTHISIYQSLLNIDPTSVQKLFTEFPTIGGHSIYDVALEFPDILLIPVENIKKWISLLGKYEVITFKVTKQTLQLFQTGIYKIVEERLFSLSRHPEWKIIMYSDQLFRILKQPYGVKRVVEVLSSDQPLISVTISLNEGGRLSKQVPRKVRSATPEELVNYISQELDLEQEETKKLLTSNNCIRCHFGLSNSYMVLELIKKYGFSREQIIYGIEIINFKFSDVEQVLEEFSKNPEAQPHYEWMANPYVIHLLMYLMKKTVLYS